MAGLSDAASAIYKRSAIVSILPDGLCFRLQPSACCKDAAGAVDRDVNLVDLGLRSEHLDLGAPYAWLNRERTAKYRRLSDHRDSVDGLQGGLVDRPDAGLVQLRQTWSAAQRRAQGQRDGRKRLLR